MGKKEVIQSFIVSGLITLVFFYKVLLGLVSFPGDILVSESKPWSTYSYKGYLPGTFPNKAQYPDVIRQLYPWRILSIDQLKQGEAPLWNPYNFSGSPLLANFQSAPFYPLNVFFWLFSDIDAWTILVMLQSFLALWFTYLYLRMLSLAELASWFGAVSYSFSSYFSVVAQYNTIGHVTLWFPLVLLSLEVLRKKNSATWLGILLASLTNAALAGHPQVFAYTLVASWCYGLVRIRPLAKSLGINIFTLLSIGIASLQYIPGIELISHAARSLYEPSQIIDKLLIQPWQLLMLPFPNIFGNPATRTYWPQDTYAGKVTSIGLIPLFFIPALWRKRKNQHAKLFMLACVILLILVTNNPINWILAHIAIPLWSTSNPTLMVFLLEFSLSASLAIGIDAWTREHHTVATLTRRVVAVAVGFALLVGFLSIAKQFSPGALAQKLHVALRAVIYAAAISAALCLSFAIGVVKPHRMKFALVVLLFIHTADLLWMFHRFNPFTPKDFVYPQTAVTEFLKNQNTTDRFWGYGTAAISANIATHLRLYSPDGYDPLYPRWYGEFMQQSYTGNIGPASRSDAMVAPGFGELDLPSNIGRLTVLDHLGIKYILDRAENASTHNTFPSDRFRLVYEQNGWKIFENLKALPRTYLKPRHEKNKASIRSYSPNTVTIDVAAESPSELILSDTYYPGWNAYVDGLSVPIIQSFHAFRSVQVPSGAHTVTFRFESSSYRLGITASLISVITALSILILIARRTYEKK